MLIISSGKLTGRVLKAALLKYLAYQKERRNDPTLVSHGKQSVKKLVGQNQGVSNIKITDSNIKDFDRVARKYGVDYAIKKDISASPPRYLVFFKARDTDALTEAFNEYTAKKIQRASRPSVRAKLREYAKLSRGKALDRVKIKDRVIER